MPAESPLRDREPAGFDLIETLRWDPAEGFIRRNHHLTRLAASAAELGFECDNDRIAAALAGAVADSRIPLRVRLVLSPDGKTDATAQPYQPLEADTIWKLRLARTRLASTDRLLRHKTTRREAYAQARAEYPASDADEVLLANERGEVCEGAITTLFADLGDGILATPRLGCGLLAGVLRGEMLDEGKAVETILAFDDLRTAKALFVGNSLRGLIPAQLA